MRGLILVLGHWGSATQRPGCFGRVPSGGVQSCIQARSIGSFSTPFSMPFSQLSHHFTASCRKPGAGAGGGGGGGGGARGAGGAGRGAGGGAAGGGGARPAAGGAEGRGGGGGARERGEI